MIYKLRGACSEVHGTGAVIEVAGVGYLVEMPLSHLCRLPAPGEPIEVFIYTHVREDALRLFGFLSAVDRRVFETLISLNGVGPKVGLAMLSTLDVAAIRQATLDGRPEVFESVPGIGKRTAERLLVELKAKLERLQLAEAGAFDSRQGALALQTALPGGVVTDVKSALENFGYKRKNIDQVLDRMDCEVDESFQGLMRRALVELSPKT